MNSYNCCGYSAHSFCCGVQPFEMFAFILPILGVIGIGSRELFDMVRVLCSVSYWTFVILVY